MKLSDIKFLKIGDEVILKPSVKGMSPNDPQYNDWVSLKGKTGTVVGKDWQSRREGGTLISVEVDGTVWDCGPGDIIPATSAIEDRKNDAEIHRKELFNWYRDRVTDELIPKKLVTDNKPYIEEAFKRLKESSLTEASIGDFSKDTSLKHINQNSSDMLEYVRYALKNKQDENEDYSIAQYILNNLKKDIEDNVRYWAKNRIDISKIKKDYEGCVVLFDKYGTCPDKQLIIKKITNKINELFSEYKKNFDTRLENIEKRNNMNKLYESANKGFNRKYFKESLSDEDMYDFQADMESAIFRAVKRVIKNWSKYGLDSSDVENYLSDILEAAEEHIREEL